MRLLIVAHESDYNGGANRSLYSLIDYWYKNKDIQIEVLVPKKTGELVNSLRTIGIPVHVGKYYKVFTETQKDGKNIFRYTKLYAKFFLNSVNSLFLVHRLKSRGYNLIYTNTRMTNIGAAIAKKLQIPHVIHIREFGNPNTVWGPNAIKRIYAESDCIIAITNALASFLTNDIEVDKIKVSHNGIPSIPALSNKEILGDNIINILITGRINVSKGQHEAIEAMVQLKQYGINNVKLHIAGGYSSNSKYEVDYYNKLLQMISENDMSDMIIFHGEVKDMASLREEMDIELMCAECETFGRVTVEGMRSGLLLIGTDTGGTPEIITDRKTGLLYHQGDSSDLFSKILWAVTNKDAANKIMRTGLSYANTHFTVERNAEEIYSIFESIAKKGGK